MPKPLPSSAVVHHPAVTPMAFVRAIARAYQHRGLSADRALQLAQIDPLAVEKDGIGITALQFETLSDAAMQELDDEALGWFSRRLPWGSYGMLARASLTSPNLGVALKRWCRHHGLLTDDLALSLQVQGETATVEIIEHTGLGELREFCLVSMLRNMHGLSSWFVDSSLPLFKVSFPFEAPAHADVYALLFPGDVQFGAPVTRMQFDARYLALPIARDEAALQRMLQRALPLTVRPYRRDRLMVQRVRQLLAADPSAMHSADSLSAKLHLSLRTLHRQLKDEGASLQALKDEVRRERSLTLLHRSNRPIKQIAQLAGFSNDKSFIRAFRTWMGMSPAEYRKSTRPPT
ncbi:AraC family transcriptional regulator [Comamonas piscis]|nr:AraC family transcriptional regulator [Comamonas piscis]WSO33825.1 AraC family transcriptional regulator [Comamonas piscis]